MPAGRWGPFRVPAVLGCQLSRRKGVQNSAFLCAPGLCLSFKGKDQEGLFF